jgi:hypothetical protein
VPRESLDRNVVALALCAALAALAPALAAPADIPPAAPPAAPPIDLPPAPPPEPPSLEDYDPLLRGSLEAEASDPAPALRPRLPGAAWPRPSPPPYPRPATPHPRAPEPALPLPALTPYKGSYVARQAARQRGRAQPAPPATVAAPSAVPTRLKRRIEENPFDPIGLRIGSTVLFPWLETSGGLDDNPNRYASVYDPKPSGFFRGSGGVRVKSDWSRHSVEGELRGGYTDYFTNSSASRPDATGQVAARYDIARDTAVDMRGSLSFETMRPGAPGLTPILQTAAVAGQLGVSTGLLLSQSPRLMTNRPAIMAIGAQIGPTQRFGRFEVSARGTYDRIWYQDAYYSDGSVSNLARTSYNDFGALLRVSYEATPAFKPFIEATPDRRVHDYVTDMNGFYRDSVGYILRGGAAVEISGLLKGEISGGYGQRDYVDPRLPPLRGPVIDVALIYTPSPLTTVTLRGATSMNETTVPYASGALTQAVTATLSHDLLRNLNVTVTGNYFYNNYQGSYVLERGGGAGVQLEYKLTRSVSLRGSFMRQILDSTYANSDYTANVYTAGLRFQL